VRPRRAAVETRRSTVFGPGLGNPGLRGYLEDTGIAYVMAIPKTTEFTDRTGTTVVIEHRAARLAPNDWQRRACGIGTKGFRVYDWHCSTPTIRITNT
jgi:hypothetical protein